MLFGNDSFAGSGLRWIRVPDKVMFGGAQISVH